MKTIAHRIYLLPGPELDKLISDQGKELATACPPLEHISVTLWIEDAKGVRTKSCQLSAYLPDDVVHITKSGSTHILAIREAFRTARNRLGRVGWRTTVET